MDEKNLDKILEKLDDHSDKIQRLITALIGFDGKNGVRGEVGSLKENQKELIEKIDSLKICLDQKIDDHEKTFHPSAKKEERERRSSIIALTAVIVSISSVILGIIL
jgi:hypothetical protein